MAVREVKLRDVEETELRKMMQYIFLLIGLKGQNVPVSPEKEFIHEYIRLHYGGHTTASVRLAFDMAVQGKLRIRPEDVKCYENFSVAYFASIMNAFQAWASEAAAQLPQEIVEAPKLLDAPVDWRKPIDEAFAHYLLFGAERSNLWPAEFYDQLVQDGALRSDLFKRFVKAARKELVANQVREKQAAILSMASISNRLQELSHMRGKRWDEAKDRTEMAKSITQTNQKTAEQNIKDLADGKLDASIVLRAKQIVVVKYFQELKDQKIITVYTTKPKKND